MTDASRRSVSYFVEQGEYALELISVPEIKLGSTVVATMKEVSGAYH